MLDFPDLIPVVVVEEYLRSLPTEVEDVAQTGPREAGDSQLQGEAELLAQHGQLLQQVVSADRDFFIKQRKIIRVVSCVVGTIRTYSHSLQEI